MYEEYLTKALVGIINAKQAMNNYQKLNKDLKNTAAYNETDSDKIKQIYKHDLDALYKLYCKPFNIYVPAAIKKNAKMYSLWEAESRYSLGFQVRANSLEAAIKHSEEWLIKLKPTYKSHLLRINAKLQLTQR